MKKALALVLTLALALALLTACGGDNSSTPDKSDDAATSPGSQETPKDNQGGSDLINEWPKAIYDPYNIPQYTDGNIVCVDESPYSIPSANTFVDGSAVHIAGASFAELIAYVKALKTENVGTILDSDIASLENKEDGSGSVTVTLADGKNIQIGWWGYEDQSDFYYNSASEKVGYTYNVEFFIYQ